MCGLNGIISKKNIFDIDLRLENMNNSIFHRGPNSGGNISISNKYGFGHRRLSIIDLDRRSNQPMISNSERYILVYNGEIINYKEIKKELEYDFKTSSDTEVILAAIETKDIDWLLKKANGMFAFAVYDKLELKLTLVRDRFGIKPLYFYQNEDCLVFSSEIKGILSSGLVEAIFRDEAIDEYLGNRHIREPFTFFKNIQQVKSSHYIVFDLQLSLCEKKYWDLPKLNFSNHYNEAEIIEETDKQIRKAIKSWLISDVKVGTYLSGGVDSSLITAIAAKTIKNVDTYTIGFKEKGYNEFEYARLVAKKYHTNHREFLLDSNTYIDEWEKLIWYKDSPLGVPNEIPLSIMSTNLSKDITVVISGEGADELFGGYGQIFRLPFDYSNNPNNLNNFYTEFIKQYEYVSRDIRNKYIQTNNDREYFDNQLINEFNNFSNEENVFRFFHQFHIKGLLQRVDMNTMQASVEARPPFLDHELIEYVYQQVPYSLKLKWKNYESKKKAMNLHASQYSESLDTPKFILKEIGRKYLPNEIIDRRKMGFPVPLTNWLPELITLAENLLSNATWVRNNEIHDLISEIKLEKRSGQLLWMLLNVEMFKQKYFSKNWKY